MSDEDDEMERVAEAEGAMEGIMLLVERLAAAAHNPAITRDVTDDMVIEIFGAVLRALDLSPETTDYPTGMEFMEVYAAYPDDPIT